ncbi:MAG: class I SAM-dependent methyltransferase [Nitrospira sp.]|nr:class I SAM-dependent methyltransferase [Nitrospira sp.]
MMETVACNLCGSSGMEPVAIHEEESSLSARVKFALVRCMECGLLFVNPRPTWGEIGAYYPPVYYVGAVPRQPTSIDRLGKRLSRLVKRWVMEDYYGYPAARLGAGWRWLRKFLLFPEWAWRVLRGRDILPYVGGGRLLDVGCGGGVNLKSFQDQVWKVFGVEMNAQAVAYANARVGECVHAGTLEDAPFQHEFFDVIVFSHSLEHMFSPREVLARAWQLLKPGGMLVVTVPNAGSLEAKLFGTQWIQWDIPRHLYHFERPTLRRLLRDGGYQVRRERTGVGTAFFLASLERAWMHRLGREFSLHRIVKPFVRLWCLAVGHLGHGTEITVYAVKAPKPAAHC